MYNYWQSIYLQRGLFLNLVEFNLEGINQLSLYILDIGFYNIMKHQ